MPRPCLPARRSLLLAVLVAALSAPSARAGEAPPSLPDLLAGAREAAGGSAWDEVEGLSFEVGIQAGGLEGKALVWEDVRSCRSTASFELGPVHGRQGFDGAAVWSQDSTGQVHVDESEEARQGAANEAFLRCQGLFVPERWPAEVSYGRRVEEEGRAFHVLAITPRGGRTFELWIDAATLLADRTVDRRALETRTVFFSDYRQVAGLRIPHRQRSTNGDERYDQLAVVERVELNPELAAGRFAVPASEVRDVRFAAGQDSTSLSFDLLNNHIYIQARINGQGPLTLLVDTGGANILTPAAAASLGIAGEGSFQVRGVGEESAEMALARVSELAIGEVALRDQVFAVLPLADLDRVEGVALDGLVGFEVFKRFAVEIDYAARRLTLTRPEAFAPPAGAAVIPFTFAGSIPQVEGELDGIPGLFTVDTGSRSTLTLHAPFVAEHGLVAKYGARIEALTGWGVGGGVRTRPARAGSFRLGSGAPGDPAVVFAGPVIDLFTEDKGAFANRYVAGNVGGGLLRRFTVTFDYDGQRLYLAPNAERGKPFPYDRAGLWINREAGGEAVEASALRVEDVVPGSPAAEAGLAEGDRILAVDGRPAAEWQLSALRERLRSDPPGTVLRLTVGREGEAREVSLRLADRI